MYQNRNKRLLLLLLLLLLFNLIFCEITTAMKNMNFLLTDDLSVLKSA